MSPHDADPTGAALPANETERLDALRSYRVLDTLPEDVYDDFAFLASLVCQTPIALVSFVDEGRQFIKANVGLSVRETPRDVAFCAHAILGEEPFIIHDATADARFASNPLVTDEPQIRFYAGIPLRNAEGLALGTLCVIDRIPRQLSADQERGLAALARQAMGQLELRRVIARLTTTLSGAPPVSSSRAAAPQARAEADIAAERARTLLAQGEAQGPMEERIRGLLARLEELQSSKRGR